MNQLSEMTDTCRTLRSLFLNLMSRALRRRDMGDDMGGSQPKGLGCQRLAVSQVTARSAVLALNGVNCISALLP